MNNINSTICLLEITKSCLTPGVNSLIPMDGHDRPLFNELRARMVSQQIFVRYQHLMARKIAELFGLNRGVHPFYAACCFG